MILKKAFFSFLALGIGFSTLGCAAEEVLTPSSNYVQVGRLLFKTELVNANSNPNIFYVNLSIENEGTERILLSTSSCPLWMNLKLGNELVWDQAWGNYCPAAMVYLYIEPGEIISLSSSPASFDKIESGSYDLYVYLKSYGGINVDIWVDKVQVVN